MVNKYHILIIESPRQVFIHESKAVELLTEILHPLTAKSFRIPLELQPIEELHDIMLNTDYLLLLCGESQIMGFLSAQGYKSEGMLYIYGIAIDQEKQSKGIGRLLLESCIKFSQLPYIAAHTQNPAIYRLMSGICTQVYPSPFLKQEDIPANITKLGVTLSKKRRDPFNSLTFIARDIYAQRPIYSKFPEISDQRVNQWFKNSLSVSAEGSPHGFLFIGLVRK